MMERKFSLDHTLLDRLFPFYVLVDRDLNIVSIGSTLRKLFGYVHELPFAASFEIKRPITDLRVFDDLAKLKGQLIVMETKVSPQITLRGEFEFLEAEQCYLFVGTPWFSSMEQVRNLHLTLDDFALHDPMIDLLHVLKNQEITTSELKQVLQTVNQQKKELERLSLIIQQSNSAVIVTDKEGRTEWVNEAFSRITGYTLEDVKGEPPGRKLQGPKTDPAVVNYIRQQIRNAQPFSCEIYNYNKNGKGYWLRINGQPILDKQGNVSRFFAIEEDITKEKEAQDQLKVAVARMSTLITNIQAGILLENENRTISLINQQFCDLFGIPVAPANLIGSDCSTAAEQSKGMFKDPESFVKRIDQILEEKKVVTGDELELADGRFFNRDFVPLWNEGSYTGHLWIYRDVTASRMAEAQLVLQEEKYRNIIANMNLGLLEVDNDDLIQFANQSFCRMSGFELSELIGRKAAGLLTEKEESVVINRKSANRKEGISDMYSVRVKNKKGEYRWWAISGAPRYNDKGEILGSVGIHLDITEQRQLQEELLLAKQKAEESSNAKQAFLATMSHEIRTPLNAIIGIIDLMQSDAKNINKQNIDILGFSSKTLLALITDILDFAKIDSGKIELINRAFDLRLLLNGIYQMFRPVCEEKNVALTLSIDESVPDIVISDELRLSQILNNLISNAVKFTQKGFVKISVSADVISGDKSRLHFNVTDSGIGIKKENLKRIFDDFDQGDKNIAYGFGGTGLGLSITKKLIQLKGGEIKVESKPNKGSSFSFSLDFRLAGSLKNEKASGKIQVAQAGMKKIDKKILVVEDNIINQKVIVSYLDRWGFSFETAMNGKEALAKLGEKKFDIALIDLFMPVMDGFETIRHIRKNKSLKGFPIIAITASAETDLMSKAIQVGANVCLTKPFNSTQLHETILEWINSNESEKEKENTTFKKGKGKNKKQALIKLDLLEDASLGSKSFLLDLLDSLNNEVPQLVSEAEKLLLNKNYKQFGLTIHKLKSSLLMLGMESLKDDMNFMEKHAQGKPHRPEVKIRFDKLMATWVSAKKELEKALKELK